jgi:hypothetical protein
VARNAKLKTVGSWQAEPSKPLQPLGLGSTSSTGRGCFGGPHLLDLKSDVLTIASRNTRRSAAKILL